MPSKVPNTQPQRDVTKALGLLENQQYGVSAEFFRRQSGSDLIDNCIFKVSRSVFHLMRFFSQVNVSVLLMQRYEQTAESKVESDLRHYQQNS